MRNLIVFVLGAGASKDFGQAMPVGSELAAKIEMALHDEFGAGKSRLLTGPIASAIARTGLAEKDRIAANNIRLGLHAQESIDDLLNDWRDSPEMIKVGKIAIANAIIEAEQLSALGRNPRSNDDLLTAVSGLRQSWLAQLCRFYKPTVRRRDIDQVLTDLAFISFNYDRCLEVFLFAEIQALSGKTEREALKIINSLPIVHPYGFLGTPFENDNDTFVPYGNASGLLWHIAQNIKTYTEEDRDSSNLARIENILSRAVRVVFLGFGYHPKNIELLTQLGLSSAPEIMGACLNPDPARLNAAERMIDNLNPNRVNFTDISCSKYMLEFRNAVLN